MMEYSGTDNLEVMKEALNYNRFLLSLVLRHAKKGERVVDFGAGIGTFSTAVSAYGFSVHCVEPDRLQAELIAKGGLPVVPSIEAYADESIDYLYTLNVLEHIEDDVTTIATWHKKLRSGGKALVYVPAFQVLFSSMDRKVGHVRRYTRADLIRKLKAHDFKVESACYVDSAGFFASLLFRFFGNESGSVDRNTLVLYDRFVFPLSRLCDAFLGRFIGKNLVVIATK